MVNNPQNARTAWAAALLLGLAAWATVSPARAQQDGDVDDGRGGPQVSGLAGDATPGAPTKVEVRPEARDDEIRERLTRILKATGWFTDPEVQVDQGVVFLRGRTDSEQFKKWAADLASNTQDVVAVVNRIEATDPSPWDWRPALIGLKELWRKTLRTLPFVAFGAVILVLAWIGAVVTTRVTRAAVWRRFQIGLLREVLARGSGLLVFLLGLYIVLQVSGLTRLALTVVGGTGLFGLVVGIAFRDITENFLASIFLSMQQPFRAGDLVDIDGTLGLVQRVTIRTTILMSLDGNHVQIPNATVYKSTIRNYTSNPNRREDFTIGIGYDDLIASAQQIALDVLSGHPAVLRDPEPWVLVDSLGAATVNLRVYFWLDGSRHSWLKVRSSVIRLMKRAFQQSGISMPDEAREVVFPKGVPVRMLNGPTEQRSKQPATEIVDSSAARESDATSTQAEGGLHSETEQIQQQALHARVPEEGQDLLSRP